MNTLIQNPLAPMSKVAFETLFGTEQNSNLLIDLINNMVQPPQPVTTVEHLTPYDDSTHCDGQILSANVRAKDQEGRIYHITLQLDDMPCLAEQMSFNLARECTEIFDPEHDPSKTQSLFSIWLLIKPYYDDDEYHHVHKIQDRNSGLVLTEDVVIHTFELNKWHQPQPIEQKH